MRRMPPPRSSTAIVHEYEMSRHAPRGVTLPRLPPARPRAQHDEGPSRLHDRHTADGGQLRQLSRGRVPAVPAQPARRRVVGGRLRRARTSRRSRSRSASGIHPGGVKRPPHPTRCARGTGGDGERLRRSCHASASRTPTASFGTCTACHTRHTTSVELARLPTTCGQCHMGPDHSQIEIYEESKHGVMFAAQRAAAEPRRADRSTLTTRDMFVPTCATCHMSGLNGAEGHARPVRAAV